MPHPSELNQCKAKGKQGLYRAEGVAYLEEASSHPNQ